VRIEPHALPDDGFGHTGRAPDGKRHFESDSAGSLCAFAARCAVEASGGRVGQTRVEGVGRVVPAHVEALHGFEMAALRARLMDK
jgi:hypothetical protein